MTRAEWLRRIEAAEEATDSVASVGPDGDGEYITVAVYNDPERASEIDMEPFEWSSLMAQPSAEEYQRYQEWERERVRRLDALPPTAMRIKREPREVDDDRPPYRRGKVAVVSSMRRTRNAFGCSSSRPLPFERAASAALSPSSRR
jgi:hypothetical protein